MLKTARVVTALPVQDLDRAKAFYSQKLGLQPSDGDANNAFYRFADGTEFNLFKTAGSPSGTHTQMAFVVDEIATEVKGLRSKGVRFEEYDFPGLKFEQLSFQCVH